MPTIVKVVLTLTCWTITQINLIYFNASQGVKTSKVAKDY